MKAKKLLKKKRVQRRNKISQINPTNLSRILSSVEESALKSGRKAEEITLMAITKTFPIDAVNSAIKHNLFVIGESRVQEAEQKLSTYYNRDKIELHLIGGLQKNKVRKAVKTFDVIQTVDSISLANRINRIAREEGKTQKIYLQVNTGLDPLKQGFNPTEIHQAAKEISTLINISVEGMMMIPPHIKIDDKYRKIYSDTRKIRDKLIEAGIKSCMNLSMGMSRDFQLAIEEGATHIRIGTALFGGRS
jgi:hypothetical protein